MVRQWQQLFWQTICFDWDDQSQFCAIAEGYYIKAKKVTKREDLDAAAEMMASKKIYFLEVMVEKENNVFQWFQQELVSDIRLS
jgi:acetolactate synthase-1/2/3 large subunit